MLKPAYRGPYEDLVYSYAGNLSVSFALYFAAIDATIGYRRPRLAAAVATLIAVEAFELTNGFFGVMGNVFDPFDLLASAAGIGLAILVDATTASLLPSGGGQGGASRAFVGQAPPAVSAHGALDWGREASLRLAAHAPQRSPSSGVEGSQAG